MSWRVSELKGKMFYHRFSDYSGLNHYEDVLKLSYVIWLPSFWKEESLRYLPSPHCILNLICVVIRGEHWNITFVELCVLCGENTFN